MISEDVCRKLSACLGLEEGMNVVMFCDEDGQFLGQPFEEYVASFANITHINISHWYEENGKTGFETEVPQEFEELVEQADCLFWMCERKNRNGKKWPGVMIPTCNRAKEREILLGYIMNVSEEEMNSLFAGDPEQLRDETEKLATFMRTVKTLHITTPAGTDVLVELSEKHPWIASTGFIGSNSNNPAPSEVFTYPANVNGTIVIDGSYTGVVEKSDDPNLWRKLKETPVIWTVKEGVIVDVQCDNAQLLALATQELDVENARRIGELGIGTNTGIKQLFGGVYHDEKYPGVHFANGYGFGKRLNCPYGCSVHHDGILLDVTAVTGDGVQILKDGEFVYK